MNRSVQLSKVNPGSFLFATSLCADISCVCPPTCGYYQSLHKVELHELNPEFASGRGSTLESPRFISDSGVKDCKGSHDIRNFGNQRVCLKGFYGIVSSRQVVFVYVCYVR